MTTTYDFDGIARGFITRNDGPVAIDCSECDRAALIDNDATKADHHTLVRLMKHAHSEHGTPVRLYERRTSYTLSPWMLDHHPEPRPEPSHADGSCGCTDPYCQA